MATPDFTPADKADILLTGLYPKIGITRLTTMVARDGVQGDTIKFEKEPTITPEQVRVQTSADRAAGNHTVIYDDPDVTFDNLEISTKLYKGVNRPAEWNTYVAKDFRPLISLAAQTIVLLGLDARTASLLETLPAGNVEEAATGDAILSALVDARTDLIRNFVPIDEVKLVVGTGIAAVFLKDKTLAYSETGNGDALRDATIGRLYGMETVVSTQVPEFAAYVFHPSALITGIIVPALDDTAKESGRATTTDGDFGLTYNVGYDPATTFGKLFVYTYTGNKVLYAARGLKLEFTAPV